MGKLCCLSLPWWLLFIGLTSTLWAADKAVLEREQALLKQMEIKAEELKPLHLETALVNDNQPAAIICHANQPAWLQAARQVQQAIQESTGVTLQLVTAEALEFADADQQNVILLGHLSNNRHVARLYHNFFVCLDEGFTGHSGYVLRTVHDPFGTGHNYLLAGGSAAEGTQKAAAALSELIAAQGKPGNLSLGRLLEIHPVAEGRTETKRGSLSPDQITAEIKRGQNLFSSPGLGRTGVSLVVRHGINYHRTGEASFGQAFKGLMLALLDYYRTDQVINEDGMGRYDNDFRDSWTYEIALLWDLTEESGLFDDEERLALTNLVMRLGLECMIYQRYNRDNIRQQWDNNDDIVHNHNSFPALGVYFAGQYFKRHYQRDFADDWIAIGHGVFRGQRHSPKPLEDSAAYQWLVPIHTMIYSLAENDPTYFADGHAREMARVAVMVMDNAGYQAAFGDYSSLKASSMLGATMQMAGFWYRDPGLLWAAQQTIRDSWYPLDQNYSITIDPVPPASQVGAQYALLPRKNYDSIVKSPFPTQPNLPLEVSFDKISLRAGWERDDAYLLLDGFGRGNHMHFDANAIISFAQGGEPLLVDGEYIKNAPKYHNSLVIIRNGQSELTPALTGLGRLVGLGPEAAFSRTYINDYNGAHWTRSLLWRGNDYFVVSDEVEAAEAGDFTLRCCWRPWGEASLEGGVATVEHEPMRLQVSNADGATCSLEMLKAIDLLPISRLAQQVSLSLQPGERYRFVNLVQATPQANPRDLQVRQIGDGLVVVERPEGAEIIALDRGLQQLPGVTARAEMLTLSDQLLLMAAGTSLQAGGQMVLEASAPVSLRLEPASGRGLIVAEETATVKLNLPTGCRAAVGDQTLEGAAAGEVSWQLTAGTHSLQTDPFALWAGLTEAHQALRARPAEKRQLAASVGQLPDPGRSWSFEGFEAAPQPLTIAQAESTVKPLPRYDLLERLYDGVYNSSTGSVMWPAGETVAITLTLPAVTEVHEVMLREWHMAENWDIGERKLEISSDGFQQDVRVVETPFIDRGTEAFGNNINTLIAIPVSQQASQLRLTLSPARKECTVYLAEVEVRGTIPGKQPPVMMIAKGDVTGDGHPELIIGSEYGQLAAVSATGEILWTCNLPEHPSVEALICADFDGDGKDEVAYGGKVAQVGLIGSDGQRRWVASPPSFRGLSSNVMTLSAGDLTGDGNPDLIAGCVSWQYFAYDAVGKELWRNVIYAHSATVSTAADLDGDGRAETVAGNSYYRLNLIDPDGKRLWAGRNIGPEMTAVATVDVDGDGRPEILTGVDSGLLHCYQLGGDELWQANLGDKITTITGVDLDGDGQPEIVCTSESAHVFALNRQGEIIWRQALPDGVYDLAVAGEGAQMKLVVAAGEGGVVTLEPNGKPVACTRLETPARQLQVLSSELVAVRTSEGTVDTVHLPK